MTKITSIKAGEPATVGSHLRLLRRQARLSQLDLALSSGISQRHLSWLETGRARPSPPTLHALLMAMDTPLDYRNRVFLAAGFAPRYEAVPLTDPGMDAVRCAITHVLQANNPAPAIVIDSHWQVLTANAATAALFDLLGLPADTASQDFNLLATLLAPGGLGDHLIDGQEIRRVAWQRASREALGNPWLAQLLESLPAPAEPGLLSCTLSPLLLTRLSSSSGELRFLSTFTTFGMPQDITVASLRIEHLIPADPATWDVMRAACARIIAPPF